MNTGQLTRIMECISGNTLFIGALPCDHLPETPFYNGRAVCGIINTHNSSLPGEHWLGFFISRGGDVHFFDSFGNSPRSQLFPSEIYAFLKSAGHRVIYSNRQVQDPMAITCGEHCVFFLFHMLKGMSYSDVMLRYSSNFSKNDKMVSLFVKKIRCYKKGYNALTCVQCAHPNTRFLKH